MTSTVLSIMVLAAFALTGGAFYLWRTKRAGKQALLMLVLVAVIAVNIAIWTLPDSSGTAPLDRQPAEAE